MSKKPETPFENIEGAHEYTSLLLEAAQDARKEVQVEIARVTDPKLGRRKEALQLVQYKLEKLSSHLATSRQILNDLRMLRRLLLDERKTHRPPGV